MIAENLKNVRNRIRQSCLNCGRNPDEITLVAVSKTFPGEQIALAVSEGQLDFGENYVQELNEKYAALHKPEVRWHFIGRLQSNKVKYIAGYVHLIHSVDNFGLAQEIQKRGERLNRSIDVLVEVHTTEEATKSGVSPDKTVGLVEQVSKLDKVHVQGLMTIGPFSEDPEDSRPSFRQVVSLKREIERMGNERVTMKHLSMGMSHDFDVAIQEGATIVRIGTAIFGKRIAA